MLWVQTGMYNIKLKHTSVELEDIIFGLGNVIFSNNKNISISKLGMDVRSDFPV